MTYACAMNQAVSETVAIVPLGPDGFDEFKRYLDDHLRDNGRDGAPHFQPMARATSVLAPQPAAAWRAGLELPLGSAGWRRTWVATSTQTGALVGHVDLRWQGHEFAAHRCLLGMGVARDHRRVGLGARLVAHAEGWAQQAGGLDWIDLQVLSANMAAVRLYERFGFTRLGETVDLFRIDGLSLSAVAMCKRVNTGRHAVSIPPG